MAEDEVQRATPGDQDERHLIEYTLRFWFWDKDGVTRARLALEKPGFLLVGWEECTIQGDFVPLAYLLEAVERLLRGGINDT